MTRVRHRDRGAPHRDGPRRLRGRASATTRRCARPTRPRSSRRSMKQLARAHGLVGHVHGEVERRSPGLERAPAPVALERRAARRRRATRSTTRKDESKLSRDGAPLPRRSGRAHARADGALLADDQQLQALRARRVGAAHRVVGRREPHLRDPRHPRRRRARRASSTGRPRPTSTRTSRSRRASPQASTGSRTRSSRRPQARGDAGDRATELRSRFRAR